MKALMNQIRLQKEIYLIGFGIMGGLFVFGTILHEIIIMADGAAGEVFCMGSMMSVAGIGAAMLFGVPAHMVNIFNYAISMGRTRRSLEAVFRLDDVVLVSQHVGEDGAVELRVVYNQDFLFSCTFHSQGNHSFIRSGAGALRLGRAGC